MKTIEVLLFWWFLPLIAFLQRDPAFYIDPLAFAGGFDRVVIVVVVYDA